MSCQEAVEYEHAIRTYLYGSLKTTQSLYWLRSFETQPVMSTIDGDRALNFEKWYTNAKFNSERQTFKLRITGLFIDDGSMNMVEANALFESLIQLIIGKSHFSLNDQNSASFAFEIIKNSWMTLSVDTNFLFDEEVSHKWTQAYKLIGVDPNNLSFQSGNA